MSFETINQVIDDLLESLRAGVVLLVLVVTSPLIILGYAFRWAIGRYYDSKAKNS